MARTLITGGAGFIASHLVRRCLDDGDAVHVILRPETDAWRLRTVLGKIMVHRLDMTDRPALAKCLADAQPDRIFHLAGDVSRRAVPNVVQFGDHELHELFLLLSLLETAAESATPPSSIVRAGSIAEYGAAPLPYRECDRERPLNAYATTILAGTHHAEMLAPQLPFDLVTARLAVIHGRDQSETFLVPSLLRRCIEGQPITLHHPHSRRDLLHVSDAVEGLCRLSQMRPARALTINVASGKAPSVAEVAEIAVEVTGADPGLIQCATSTTDTELRSSNELAKLVIDWSPRVSLREGMADTAMAMLEGRMARAS